MKHEKTLFTAGQFAKIHHINKRTLHYYDDIGLFSPAHKGENGYRYYTYLQSAPLEMLLTLRELDMSIEEINSYMKNRSPQIFHKIIEEKTREIDQKIKRLKEIRQLLARKETNLILCEESDLDRIEIVEFDEEYLMLSQSITGAYDETDFSILVEHSQDLPSHRMFNKSYGSMISTENIASNKLEDYACFFTKVEKNTKSNLFVKPSGPYIQGFCKGPWEKLPETYSRITEFAQAQGLTLKGYAYEEGLNEMAISTMDEYVTKITVMC